MRKLVAGAKAAGGETGTQAVDRAIAILFSFTEATPERRIVDLSHELDLNKSTVHRLLNALANAGLVRRDDRSGTYRLGAGTLELGARFLSALDLRTEARPHIEALVRLHGKSVNLAVIDGVDAISIDYVLGTNSLQMVSKLGRRVPIYCSASGKALIIDRSENEIRRILADVTFTPHTATTLTDIESFLRSLKKDRERGWAFNNQETEAGMRAIAAPIRDHTNAVVAAISTSAPEFRMQPARVKVLAAAAVRTANDISAAIGANADRR